MTKRVGKRGDTLIEVMLAVGIFSMVAVAVVAVMSGGTSSSQTALETTLAREEIDAQAEALRFIHNAYISDKNAGVESKFDALWEEIIKKAEGNEAATQFSPSSCQNLYTSNEDNIFMHKAFVINTKALGTFENPSNVISTNLIPASTYPRLVYGGDSLIGDGTTLESAEGIYIIAVEDPNSTNIVGEGMTQAYYDFYIRTCWYGTGDQDPSTISTVMRLYNPATIDDAI